jgi:hypothetical protein
MAGISAKLPSPSEIGKVILLGMVSLVLPLWATLVATSLTAKYQRDRVQSEFATLVSENEKGLL